MTETIGDMLVPALLISTFMLIVFGLGSLIRSLRNKSRAPKLSVAEQLQAIRPLGLSAKDREIESQMFHVQLVDEDKPRQL
jgi:hypothetical protein